MLYDGQVGDSYDVILVLNNSLKSLPEFTLLGHTSKLRTMNEPEETNDTVENPSENGESLHDMNPKHKMGEYNPNMV